MNARAIERSLQIQGTLRLLSPCHLGGPEPDATTDRPLARDEEGRPYLPGTTLAGILRGALRRYDPERTAALFGPEVDNRGALALRVDTAKEHEQQSWLFFTDAPLRDPGQPELRDGVSLDPETGVAWDQRKYDWELLPAGAGFAVTLHLALPAEGEKAQHLLGGLVHLLQILESGDLRLGARTRRGLGACRITDEGGVRWTVHDYRLSQREQLLAFLAVGRGLPWQVTPRTFASAEALAVAEGLPVEPPPRAAAFQVDVRLELAGSLLVRSPGRDPDAPDAVHLQAHQQDGQWRPVLPGTSLAGALRHRCERIALTLTGKENPQRARVLIEWLFGTQHQASRLLVPEVVVAGGQPLRHTRVALDPFTGGARESLLFTADAWYGGALAFSLRLLPKPAEEHPKDLAALALLLLALRDLAGGALPVGGEVGGGRGALRPPKDGDGVFARLAQVPAGSPISSAVQIRFVEGACQVSPAGSLELAFTALHALLSREEG